MKFHVRYSPEAEVELRQAIEWYESQRQGLGKRFDTKVKSAWRQIARNPERFRLVGSYTRKLQLTGWPYSLYFTVSKERGLIVIVAVFHGKRDPELLRARLR